MWGVVALDDIAYDNAAIVIFLVFRISSQQKVLVGALVMT